MSAYASVSIREHCNADAEVLGPPAQERLGQQTYRGLPFEIGDSNHGRLALFGAGGHRDSVSIPIGRRVRTLTFAHTLIGTRLHLGGRPGERVATYVFHFAQGSIESVAIRERFEIGWIVRAAAADSDEQRRPGAPFLAWADRDDQILARGAVERDAMGRVLTEVTGGTQAELFYLWPWRNPRPDDELTSIEIVPGERAFVLGGICAGDMDEDPLRRDARRAVVIELPDRTDAERPFDLSVEVDRGIATLAQPLTRDPTAFLASDTKGWGEPNNDASSPAYTEIAAAPSAIVTVKLGDEALGSTEIRALESGETVSASPRLRLRMAEQGRGWVHTRVVDDETGQPVPCRVHFRSPEGIPYQPHGHHAHLNSGHGTWHVDVGGDLRLDGATYAYIDGRCQGWLPTGTVVADVARGFEYEPLRTEIDIQPGQRELELRLKRWTHMNEQGWYSGDTHVHFLSGDGANTEAAGEDLNVVNVLQSQWGHLFTNTEDFIGRPRVSDDGQTIVYVSQENRQHFLGHLTLLGLKEPVMPWCSDGPGEAEAGGSMEITLSHWADACHEQGGTVVMPHAPSPNGEPATLIATGRADAFEMLRQQRFAHREYYRYLNGGYRLPLVGGTDKMSSDVPVGVYRTYVRIPDDEPFDYDTWCKHMAAGRTFLSGGPIIRLTVEGQDIGETLRLSGNGGTVEIEASAESILPIHTLEIVQEGRVIASTDESNGARRLRLTAKAEVNGHSWIAARCGGPAYFESPQHHDGSHRQRFAHTSPVFLSVGDEDWWMWSEETAQYMLTLIDGSLQYIRQRSTQYPQGHATHHHGGDDHLAYLEQPFLEAREAIHRRMHQLGMPH